MIYYCDHESGLQFSQWLLRLNAKSRLYLFSAKGLFDQSLSPDI